MRTTYLIYSFTGLVAYLILKSMANDIKWIALGFGVAMLLFGMFSKQKVIIKEDNMKVKINDLNKPKEGNKNGIRKS